MLWLDLPNRLPAGHGVAGMSDGAPKTPGLDLWSGGKSMLLQGGEGVFHVGGRLLVVRLCFVSFQVILDDGKQSFGRKAVRPGR